MLENLYQNKEYLLKKSQEFFINSSSLYPKIGCELEFFLFDESNKLVPEDKLREFISNLDQELGNKFELFHKLEKEGGESQVELKTHFTSDLKKLCESLEEIKNFITEYSKNKKFISSFIAQPFLNDCGSSLQFNISLHDENDHNIFEKDFSFLKKYSESLLNLTDSMLIILAPNEDDYLRFLSKVNIDLFKAGKYIAPMNLSFGNDNRTCAIRIPSIKTDDDSRRHYGKRIEYRIASPNADSYLAISAILVALSLQDESQNFEQVFGNAFDQQYKIKEFSKNFEDAKNNFSKGEIKKKLESLLST